MEVFFHIPYSTQSLLPDGAVRIVHAITSSQRNYRIIHVISSYDL
jgi:hypothetical protein